MDTRLAKTALILGIIVLVIAILMPLAFITGNIVVIDFGLFSVVPNLLLGVVGISFGFAVVKANRKRGILAIAFSSTGILEIFFALQLLELYLDITHVCF